MAMGLINGLTALGWSIPDDISVIGFDDVPLATMCLPNITTVRQDITAKGTTAAEVVIEAVKGIPKQDTILPLHVVERDSVKPITNRGVSPCDWSYALRNPLLQRLWL